MYTPDYALQNSRSITMSAEWNKLRDTGEPLPTVEYLKCSVGDGPERFAVDIAGKVVSAEALELIASGMQKFIQLEDEREKQSATAVKSKK